MIRCRGRGCPYRQRGPFLVRTSGARRAGSTRYVVIRDFLGRVLRPGVRLEILVTRRLQIGKYTRFTIRRGRAPLRSDRCVLPDRSVSPCG